MGRVVGIGLRQLGWVIPAGLLIPVLSFLVLRFVPGGPYDHAAELPLEVTERLSAHHDLDEPISVQLIRYVGRVGSGDLDWSMTSGGRSVTEILGSSLPISLQLGLLAFSLALLGGLVLGSVGALRRKSLLDRACSAVATVGFSAPCFALATMFVLVFSVSLALFPPALWEGPAHLILPALALAAAPGSLVARLTRDSLRSELSSDHVRTARAKGLSHLETVWRHAFRNTVALVSRRLGHICALLATGSVIVEHVFSIPGLGRSFVSSVKSGDSTVVVGLVLTYATLIIFANVLSNILRGVLDRTELSESL